MAKIELSSASIDGTNIGKRKAEESLVDLGGADFASLPPVVTARQKSRTKLLCSHEQTQSIVQDIVSNTHDKMEDEENEYTEGSCETPKSEEHKIPTVLECPPAPKKPRPTSKRKSAGPPGGFFVPPGLDLVFLPLKKTCRRTKLWPDETARLEVAQRTGDL
eukprot:Gb_23786 [translate_table: standard]